MSEGSGGKSESEQSNRVQIPSFLQPFLTQSANTASGSLGRLQSLSNTDRVAGFDPLQEQGFGMAQDFANGGGGFLPTLQSQLMNTAQGQGVSSFVPEGAYSALSGLAGNGGGIDPSVMARLSATNSLNPDSVSALTNATQGVGISDLPRGALEAAARGDFLYGGEGFDAAVDAAMRSATPRIASAFGGTAGGINSGLASAAVGQSAIDAFASQYGNERNRQLSAANALGGFDMGGTQMQLGAANSLAGLGLSQNQQNMNSAGMLEGLRDSDASRSLAASGTLAGLGDAERQRQMQALGMLPQAGLMGSDILGSIGAQRQALEQQRLNSPLDLQMQLLMASLGGLPIGSLLGSDQTGSQRGFSFGFGGE